MTRPRTRTRTGPRTLVVAGLVALQLLTAGAATATAGAAPEGVEEQAATAPDEGRRTTWTVRPAGADGPDGRTSLRHAVEPGQSVADHVAVTSFGPDAAVFRLYASDGVTGPDGAFDILPGGQAPTDGGAWVALGDVPGATREDDGSLTVELAPVATLLVPVTVAVPADATPGDHPAGVVAQVVPSTPQAVEVASRVGVRLHLRVPGELLARVEARDVHATWQPSWNPLAAGTVVVGYTLHNTGNVRAGADARVSAAGPLGALPSQARGAERELLPGQVRQAEVRVPLWGLLRARATVSVAATPVGDDEQVASAPTARAQAVVWAVPWTQALLVVLVALVVVVRVRWRRTSERRVQERIDAAVAAATASRRASAPTPAP
ncbi:hypothetical protein [Cellulomonas marina]|uniref:DUF916 domain-containing protein n=1 Tax=Cellulomonas marina TaxID=988821 RepID=A0A1I0VC06_9CELL|nr:hypothetical protein [Cellulomonas marina]GIG29167.1 hypothetical protein Cma02nite_17670 [Cellulomonas marina]SFA73583.1 hypothetical protein SAMN05421867_101292 [Cellulomonas marina]